MHSEAPWVSAIMPTYNRRAWLPQAIQCFLDQDYCYRELIIIDDSEESNVDLIPPESPIESAIEYYFSRTLRTIGAKRNVANARASGQIIVHWDDDDWSHPHRISDQVDRLLETGASVTGYSSMRMKHQDGRWFQYRGSPDFALGTSLCYWKEYWRHHPFRDLNIGEDNQFVGDAKPVLVAVDAGEMMWASIHPGNTSWRDLKAKNYQPLETVCA